MLKLIKKYVSKFIKKHRMQKIKDVVLNSDNSVLSVGDAYDARKYGFSSRESKLYNLPKNDYREYITTWESYQPRLIENRNFVISDDKFLFSTVLKNYVDVPEIYAIINKGKVHTVCNDDITNQNIYDYMLSVGGGVIKDRGGHSGFDVYVFDCENDSLISNTKTVTKKDLDDIISTMQDGLFQQRMIQGKFENTLFDKSINTLRIISMKKSDSFEHEIVAALQRIGTNKTRGIDNFAQGGGTAIIDVDTGIMSSMTCMDSVDDCGNRIFFSTHPDSGAQIEGVRIPNWDNIKNTLVDITKKLPLFEYIAWDVVVKDDGISVIETNMKSSLGVFQVHGGLRNKYLGQKYKEHGYIKD